jgi:hypothetical protein
VAEPAVVQVQNTPATEAIDQHGDLVFRFRLKPLSNPETLTLQEIYRQTIYDLLQLVRFYHQGEPVLVDEFAFLDAPNTRIRILGEEPHL